LTVCAERVAVFKAISEGERRFTRIAIVADTEAPTPPCGACRQILWEFGGDLEVILGNLKAETARYRLKELLPLPFDARLLGEKKKQQRPGGAAVVSPGRQPREEAGSGIGQSPGGATGARPLCPSVAPPGLVLHDPSGPRADPPG